MDRRKFLAALAGGTAAAVAVRSFPFRSYFFPAAVPKLAIKPGDYIIGTDFGFEPGQMIAIYDSSGELYRGSFLVVAHDRTIRKIDLEPIPDITGRPAWDTSGRGEWNGLSRAKYPGRLKTPLVAPFNQPARMAEFGDPGESTRARWRRLLLRA